MTNDVLFHRFRGRKRADRIKDTSVDRLKSLVDRLKSLVDRLGYCGFLVLEVPGITDKVDNLDELEIDMKNGKIINLTKKESYQFTPLPEFAQKIIDAGGLLNKLAKK